ncbi:capsid cement protein [Xanthomonas campestris]|uniref:capsid cement protein n=1 Tax=Xanthomonas campestris TaxID=339 RepID=UPI002B227FA9|nr:capsid cement protein [Xanthomonas campestris]MEA9657836.1 capsid cement protein [Xanthomonas campestris pv. raphani]
MKNAYQDGRVLDVTLTAAVSSGGVIAAGKLVAIAVTDGAIGDTIAAHVEGVFALPKLPAAVFAVGAAVNWDIDAKQAIAAAGGAGDTNNIGYAIEAAGNGAATVLMRLTPGTATPVAA